MVAVVSVMFYNVNNTSLNVNVVIACIVVGSVGNLMEISSFRVRLSPVVSIVM